MPTFEEIRGIANEKLAGLKHSVLILKTDTLQGTGKGNICIMLPQDEHFISISTNSNEGRDIVISTHWREKLLEDESIMQKYIEFTKTYYEKLELK